MQAKLKLAAGLAAVLLIGVGGWFAFDRFGAISRRGPRRPAPNRCSEAAPPRTAAASPAENATPTIRPRAYVEPAEARPLGPRDPTVRPRRPARTRPPRRRASAAASSTRDRLPSREFRSCSCLKPRTARREPRRAAARRDERAGRRLRDRDAAVRAARSWPRARSRDRAGRELRRRRPRLSSPSSSSRRCAGSRAAWSTASTGRFRAPTSSWSCPRTSGLSSTASSTTRRRLVARRRLTPRADSRSSPRPTSRAPRSPRGSRAGRTGSKRCRRRRLRPRDRAAADDAR